MSKSSKSNKTAEPIMVQVAAPANLPEGFQFDATFDGTTFTVTVPAGSGGVRQGQMFEVPFTGASSSGSSGTATTNSNNPPATAPGYQNTYQSGGAAAASGNDEQAPFVSDRGGASTISPPDQSDPHHIPRGQWRDGLFDFFTLGPFHPSLLMAICCPQCLNGQVLTRLKLNWLGESSSSDHSNWQSWRHTFRNVVVLMVIYFILNNIFSVPSPKYETVVDEVSGKTQLINVTPPPNAFVVAMNNLIGIFMASYSILTLMRARRTIRQRYHIPEHRVIADSPFANAGVEDCLLSMVCGCCTVAQLARHTADYQHEKPMFCTSNGLAVEEEELDHETDNLNDLHPTVVV